MAIVVPDFDLPSASDLRPRQPVIPDFDLPIIKQTPYVRGCAIGTVKTRHRHSSNSPEVMKQAEDPQNKISSFERERIEREIAMIRCEKELLRRQGKG